MPGLTREVNVLCILFIMSPLACVFLFFVWFAASSGVVRLAADELFSLEGRACGLCNQGESALLLLFGAASLRQ
jgi:hypothetical protein